MQFNKKGCRFASSTPHPRLAGSPERHFYFNPNENLMLVLSFRSISYAKVAFFGRFLVLRLKIHCRPAGSQRKLLSGVVEMIVSFTVLMVPLVVPVIAMVVTTPGVPTELQLASKTMNFKGTVLPCLNTLVPSALTGWRITCPALSTPLTRQDWPAGL